MYCRNSTSYENFKLKLCKCTRSHELDTRTKFQLEILIVNVIFGIVYFREIILRSWGNVSETIPWCLCWEQNGWCIWFHILAAVGSALNPRLGPIQSVTLCEGDSPMMLNCPGAGYDIYVDRSSVFWGRRSSSTCASASPGKNLEMCEASSTAANRVRQKNPWFAL